MRVLKTCRLLLGPCGGVQRRATYVRGKPPKDDVGVAESVFVLNVMFVALLGPSGWILAHVDEYRRSG